MLNYCCSLCCFLFLLFMFCFKWLIWLHINRWFYIFACLSFRSSFNIFFRLVLISKLFLFVFHQFKNLLILLISPSVSINNIVKIAHGICSFRLNFWWNLFLRIGIEHWLFIYLFFLFLFSLEGGLVLRDSFGVRHVGVTFVFVLENTWHFLA